MDLTDIMHTSTPQIDPDSKIAIILPEERLIGREQQDQRRVKMFVKNACKIFLLIC